MSTKRIILAIAIAFMGFIAYGTSASPVAADGGPHGAYRQTTAPDQCAGCHRLHQGKSEGKLLKAESQYAVCLTCHNGAGSVLNVLDGVRLDKVAASGSVIQVVTGEDATNSTYDVVGRGSSASMQVSVAPYGATWVPGGSTAYYTIRVTNTSGSTIVAAVACATPSECGTITAGTAGGVSSITTGSVGYAIVPHYAPGVSIAYTGKVDASSVSASAAAPAGKLVKQGTSVALLTSDTGGASGILVLNSAQGRFTSGSVIICNETSLTATCTTLYTVTVASGAVTNLAKKASIINVTTGSETVQLRVTTFAEENATDATLNGGGFRFMKGLQATSRHNADPADNTLQPWGYAGYGQGNYAAGDSSAPNNSSSKLYQLSSPLQCTSCHNPHGTTNYRLLQNVVNGNTVTVKAWYGTVSIPYTGKTLGTTAAPTGYFVKQTTTGAVGFVASDTVGTPTTSGTLVVRDFTGTFDTTAITIYNGTRALSTTFTGTTLHVVTPTSATPAAQAATKDEGCAGLGRLTLGGVKTEPECATRPDDKYMKEFYYSSGSNAVSNTGALATLCGACHTGYPSDGASTQLKGPVATANSKLSIPYTLKSVTGTATVVGAMVKQGTSVAYVDSDSSTGAAGTLVLKNFQGEFVASGTLLTVYTDSTGTTSAFTVSATSVTTTNMATEIHYRHKTEMKYTDWGQHPNASGVLGSVDSNPETEPIWEPNCALVAGACSDSTKIFPALRLASKSTNSGEQNAYVTCLTCHRVHGTSTTMEGWALKKYANDGSTVMNASTDGRVADADLSPAQGVADVGAKDSLSTSTLLYTNNRAMCEACHQWGWDPTAPNTP